MYGVYEVLTWDDVSYFKVAEFQTKKEALNKMEELKQIRKENYSDPCNDPLTYCVLDNLQYYLLMKN